MQQQTLQELSGDVLLLLDLCFSITLPNFYFLCTTVHYLAVTLLHFLVIFQFYFVHLYPPLPDVKHCNWLSVVCTF